jgi:hypothetical protein
MAIRITLLTALPYLDDFIGQVMIDVEELKDGLPHEQWFNLSPKANRGEGSVRLILKYLPVAVDNLVVQGTLEYSI